MTIWEISPRFLLNPGRNRNGLTPPVFKMDIGGDSVSKAFSMYPHTSVFSIQADLQPYDFRGHVFAEGLIVFHKQDGGPELKQ